MGWLTCATSSSTARRAMLRRRSSQRSAARTTADMRIAVVDSYYREFLRRHYRDHPAAARVSYDEQLTLLLDTLFGTSDAYTSQLRALGHDARNLIVNARELQGAWAREHGLPRWTHLPVPGT